LELGITGEGFLGKRIYRLKPNERRESDMTLLEALEHAERLLPGTPAPEGAEDPRWQAVIEIAPFIPSEPELIWPFVLKWGSHEDEDVRAAIATCLLEHLLQHHFDVIIPRVESAARSNVWFGRTTAMCWKFGEAEEPARAARFDHLISEIRRRNG
jgi:hypothetical protein